MVYKISPTAPNIKDLKKLKEKPLQALIISIVYGNLASNPKLGNPKTGDLVGYLTWNFEYPPKVRKNNRSDYRIGYKIDEETQTVHLMMVGPHENFYDKFKKRIH